jgi:protein gp37
VSNAPADYATRRWNPTTGCSHVSAGCANCWASRFATRHAGRFGYPAVAPFTPTCHPDRLDEPLRWRKPQVVAVSFMGDLFHVCIPESFVRRVVGVMADERCERHTFLLLTKRPERARAILTSPMCSPNNWPTTGLHNVYLGVSVEDQRTADERIPILLDAPAAHRWVSVEPQIGPVDLGPHLQEWTDACIGDRDVVTAEVTPALDWVVQGCESGPGRRPFDVAWARSVRDQCSAAGVPYYLKQIHWPAQDAPGHWPSADVIKHPLLDGVWHEATPWEVTP